VIYNAKEEVQLKTFSGLLLILCLAGLINFLPGETKPDPNFKSIHQTELEIHQDSLSGDTITQVDSSYGSIDKEQADQVRVFVNTTLLIIIIAILILALAVFLIINRVRRTTTE
jgi:uncharacterized membrane protein affecting hemolysin expression